MIVTREYKDMQGFKGWVKSCQIEKPETISRRWPFRKLSNNGYNFDIDYLNKFLKTDI